MDKEQLITETVSTMTNALFLSEKARHEGLLALEDILHERLGKNANRRDVFELGMRLVLDGTEGSVISSILENLIFMEKNGKTARLKEMQKEAVLSIQRGENSRIIALRMYSLVGDDELDDVLEAIKGTCLANAIGLEIEPEFFSFEDIVLLSDRDIQKVLRSIGSETLAKALKGSSQKMTNIVLRNMTRRAAEMIEGDMDYMGPLKKNELDKTQHIIVSEIKRLIDLGEISIRPV